MKRLFILLLFMQISSLEVLAKEKLKVVATIPDLKVIAQEAGGDKVIAESLAKGYQDPHYVEPRPSLMTKIREADLFVEIGLGLELWTEQILDGAGNTKIKLSQPGHVYASQGIKLLEVPRLLTRAAGDIHPYGNPHIWTDPVNAKAMAENIVQGLKRISPENAQYFEDRKKLFFEKIDRALFGNALVDILGGKILTRLIKAGRLYEFLEAKTFKGEKLSVKLGGWLKEAEPLRGKKIVFFHQGWTYFTERFGLHIANYIEEKPGILPSARHKEALIQQIRKENIKVIGITNFNDEKIPNLIASETGAKVIVLPNHVEGIEGVNDYFSFISYLIRKLKEAYGV